MEYIIWILVSVAIYSKYWDDDEYMWLSITAGFSAAIAFVLGVVELSKSFCTFM